MTTEPTPWDRMCDAVVELYYVGADRISPESPRHLMAVDAVKNAVQDIAIEAARATAVAASEGAAPREAYCTGLSRACANSKESAEMIMISLLAAAGKEVGDL